MPYYIYRNWVAEKKSVIHKAACGYCNYGKGCHRNPLGNKNGEWSGRFEKLEDAKNDASKSYKSLKQYGKHHRINKQHAFAAGRTHINGIEGFWSYAKERFHKYHGINMRNYPLYLKEMEFRFNHRDEDIYELLFNIIIRRNWCIF